MENTGAPAAGGGGLMADGHPRGGGRLMPHSAQHPAHYSPVAQPGTVTGGSTQYVGIPQPFFFHPTLNAFFPGPPPPQHPFFAPSAAPPLAAPPPAALPHRHSQRMRGGRAANAAASAAVAPASSAALPNPPPTGLPNIPVAPPEASQGFLLSTAACLPASFSSLAVPPPATHDRSISPAVVPAPPAPACVAGCSAAAVAGAKSPTAAAALHYPAQQQVSGLATGAAAAAAAAAASRACVIPPLGGGWRGSRGGDVSRFDSRTPRDTKSQGGSAPFYISTVAAGNATGSSSQIRTSTLAVAGETLAGRNIISHEAAKEKLNVESCKALPQHQSALLGALGDAVSERSSYNERGTGGGASTRSLSQREVSGELKGPLGCGVRRGETSVRSGVNSRQQECASTMRGDGDRLVHVSSMEARSQPSTGFLDNSRLSKGATGLPGVMDVLTAAAAAPQHILQQQQQREGGVGGQPSTVVTRSSGDGGRPGRNCGSQSADAEGSSAGESGSREGVSFEASPAAGGLREARSYTRFAEGGVQGATGAGASLGTELTAAAAAPVTQQEGVFWEQSSVEASGEGAAPEDGREGVRKTSLQGCSPVQRRAPNTEGESLLVLEGKFLGRGVSRATAKSQESGNSRPGTTSIVQQHLPPLSRTQQPPPCKSVQQQQHLSHAQLNVPGRRGVPFPFVPSSNGGDKELGRPYGYQGQTRGGARHAADISSNPPACTGEFRSAAASGFSSGMSWRSSAVDGHKRTQRSNSGQRRMSEGRDTRSRDSPSIERRRRRGSPSVQRPSSHKETRSRSGSVASLALGGEEKDVGRGLGATADTAAAAEGGSVGMGAGGEETDDGGEMELERSNSFVSLDRESMAGAVNDCSSISPSPDTATDVQDTQSRRSCNHQLAKCGDIRTTTQERDCGRKFDDAAQSRMHFSRGLSRTQKTLFREPSISADRNSRTISSSMVQQTNTAFRSAHPAPPPRQPPSTPRPSPSTAASFSFVGGAAAVSSSAGAAMGSGALWVAESKTKEDAAAALLAAGKNARDAGTRAEASAPSKPMHAVSTPNNEMRDCSGALRGPLFDLWVPTTFHPLCPERVRLVLGPKGRTHKAMEQLTKTRVQVYGRELVRDTSRHEYDRFRDNQPLHLVVGDKVRRGEWTEASIQEIKETLENFLEQLVHRTWPRTEQRQRISFYDKQLHVGPSDGPLVYVDPLGRRDELPPRDLLPCLVYDPTDSGGGTVCTLEQQQQQLAGIVAGSPTEESSGAASVETTASVANMYEAEAGSCYEGDNALLLNCTPPLCLLLLTLQAAHGLLVEEGVQELVSLPLAFEKKWDIRFLFRREDFQAAGPASFGEEKKELLAAAVNSSIYTPEGRMHEEAITVLTRFVKEFPEVFDFLEEDSPANISASSTLSPSAHTTLKIKARDQPDFASVAQRFKSTDPWLHGGQL